MDSVKADELASTQQASIYIERGGKAVAQKFRKKYIKVSEEEGGSGYIYFFDPGCLEQ